MYRLRHIILIHHIVYYHNIGIKLIFNMIRIHIVLQHDDIRMIFICTTWMDFGCDY